MRALVMQAPQQPVVQNRPKPHPGPGEVVIRVKRVGICGTDLHIYAGDFLSGYPLIPGHEFAGQIEDTGPGVAGFSHGDRVAADPTLVCGRCAYCLSGRSNHCEHWGAIGDTTDGAMAEFVKVPAENVVRLPDHLSFEEGAFIEPIACVVHAMRQLQLQAGQSVLLFGAGSMGQLLVQALAHAGAGELAVVDVSAAKLDLALSHGATTGIPAQEAEKALSHRTKHRGFDVVVDVTGIPAVIQNEFRHLAPKGTHLQFGVAPTDASVPVKPFDIYHMDWRLIGSMAINRTYQAALDWMAAGRFDVSYLVSQIIGLQELPAFFAAGKGADIMKVQVEPI